VLWLNEKSKSSSNRLSSGFNLRARDLRVLEALFNVQSLDPRQIAKEVSLPEKVVRRRLRALRERKFFEKKYIVNYWKIDFVPLLIVARDSIEDLKNLPGKPLIRFTKRVFASVPYRILSLAVPSENLDETLRYFYEVIGEVDIYFLKSFHESVSFRFYDVENMCWNIDFSALSLYIKEIMFKEGFLEVLRESSIIKALNKQCFAKTVKLDEWEIRGLYGFEKFQNKIFIFSKSKLGISRTKIYKLKRKTENLGVLSFYIDVYPPQLAENLFLIIEKYDEMFLEALLLGLGELPKLKYWKAVKLDSGGKDNRKDVVIIRLSLPQGGFINFLENFTKILIDKVDFKIYLEIEASETLD